jgi:hypothetical protein
VPHLAASFGFRGMTGREQNRDYGHSKPRGPDRLLMFLVLAFIGMVVLRAFWILH